MLETRLAYTWNLAFQVEDRIECFRFVGVIETIISLHVETCLLGGKGSCKLGQVNFHVEDGDGIDLESD